MTSTPHAGDKIAALLRHPSAKHSQRSLAIATAIPEATMRRKLATGDFTVRELERIITALEVEPLHVLPTTLTGRAQAEAVGK